MEPMLTSERIAEELAELRAEHAGQLADLRAENARLAAKVDQLDARSGAPDRLLGSSAPRRGWRGPRNDVREENAPVSRRRMFGLH